MRYGEKINGIVFGDDQMSSGVKCILYFQDQLRILDFIGKVNLITLLAHIYTLNVFSWGIRVDEY